MRRLAALALLVLVVVARAARADCPADVTAARREADKQVKAGQAVAALAKLAAVNERCGAKVEAGARLWLLSEMAFAAHAAGNDDRCAEIISNVDDDEAAANPKPTKALLYNAGLCKPKDDGCDYKLDHDEPVCKMKLALEYSERNGLVGFEAPRCEVKGHAKAVKLADGTCLEAGDYRKKGDDDAVCPAIYLVDAKGKRRKLGFAGKGGGGWLESPSDCCYLRSIKVKSDAGKTLVLFGSEELSRDCFGGTATTDALTLFQLANGKLEMQQDFSILWH